jgi:hypothetical protein
MVLRNVGLFASNTAIQQKVVRRWFLSAEPRVQFWVSSYEIRGGPSCTGPGLSEFLLFFAVNHHNAIPPHSSIKDIIRFIILFMVLSTLSLKESYVYILGDPDNFVPANLLVTPVHIQPE